MIGILRDPRVREKRGTNPILCYEMDRRHLVVTQVCQVRWVLTVTRLSSDR